MKKALLLLIISISVIPCVYAQNWEWARSVSHATAGGSEGMDCATDKEGSIYGTGYCFNSFYIGHDTFTNFGGGAAYVVKYDSSGNYQWAITTHTGKAYGCGITTDPYNNVYLFGGFDSVFTLGSDTIISTHHPARGYFIAKITSFGNVEWVKSLGNVINYYNQQTSSIKTDTLGYIYLACPFVYNCNLGTFNLVNADVTGTTSDILIAKLDSSGNIIWAKNYGGNSYDLPMGISIASSGNIYIDGYFNSDTLKLGSTILLDTTSMTPVHYGTFLTKTDNLGNPIWARCTSGNFAGYYTGLALNSREDVFITGSYGRGAAIFGSSFILPTPPGVSDYGFLGKYDSSGTILWLKLMQGQFIIPWQPITDQCDNVWIISNMGTSHLTADDTIDGHILTPLPINGEPNFIAGWTNSGTFITAVAMASGSTDDPNGITTDMCGNVYVIADQEECDTMIIGNDTFKNSGEDMFIAKYNPNAGCKCNNSEEIKIKDQDNLLLYPNPTDNKVLISAPWTVSDVIIINTLGQIVGKHTSNNKKIEIDVSNLPKGIYFVRINGTITRKFVKD